MKTAILLIHGTWGNAASWGAFVPALEAAGFEVHAPSLRYHDLPLQQGAAQIATLSLTDYVDDLSDYLSTMSSKPIILGHSLGGLLAQLLAARHPQQHRGMVLLGTAPMAGIFALYPSMLGCFYQHYLQWGFWKKPLYPTKKRLNHYCMNHQSNADQQQYFKMLVTESGRVYAEMALWFLDPNRAAHVDTKKITAPVLIVSGTDDRIVNMRISKATAKKYAQAKLHIISGSDHMYAMGKVMPKTIELIVQWAKHHHLLN